MRSHSILMLGALLAWHAESPLDAAGKAGRAGAYQKFGVGAEALGRGNAFVAAATDSTATYWNPAGLALMKTPHASFMQSNMSLDRKYNFVGYARPARNSGVGINYIRFGVDDIPETRDVNDRRHYNDLNNNGAAESGEFYDSNANSLADDPVLTSTGDKPGAGAPTQAGVDFIDKNGNGIFDNGTDLIIGDVKIFSYFEDMESALTLSYGKKFGKKSAWGLNLKHLRQELFTASARGFGLDLGLLHDFSENTRAGLTVRDIGSYVKWNTDSGDRDTFPLKTTLGMRHQFNKKCNATLDLFLVEDLDPMVRAGAEYWLSRNGAFRVGVDDGEFVFGVGLKKDSWRFDYAYLDEELGVSQRLSASREF